jgi:hypothetical protein
MFRLNDYFFFLLMPPMSDSNPYKWLQEMLDKGDIPVFEDGQIKQNKKSDMKSYQFGAGFAPEPSQANI